MEVTHVLIGIQARTTSERFPGKVLEKIGHKAMIEHVIDSCQIAAKYTNRFTHKTRTLVDVALLVPAGDELTKFRHKVQVREGSENDVLSRYVQAANQMKADYIVRVTGDCPLLPSFLISKMIKTAVVNAYDYVSNVDPKFRTAVDGHDCEVISRRLLDHIDKAATQPHEREHVTWMARANPPEWACRANVVGFLDLSNQKLSVDTLEDLERVRAVYERVRRITDLSIEEFGKPHVHKV